MHPSRRRGDKLHTGYSDPVDYLLPYYDLNCDGRVVVKSVDDLLLSFDFVTA